MDVVDLITFAEIYDIMLNNTSNVRNTDSNYSSSKMINTDNSNLDVLSVISVLA